MAQAMKKLKDDHTRDSRYRTLLNLLSRMVRARCRHGVACLSGVAKEARLGPSIFTSIDISPIDAWRRLRGDADSFISLPGKMGIISNRSIKSVTPNHRAILWLSMQLVKEQQRVAFALMYFFASRKSGHGVRNIVILSADRSIRSIIDKDNYVRTAEPKSLETIVTPIIVESMVSSQIMANSTAKLLGLCLNRLFRSALKRTFTEMVASSQRSPLVTHKLEQARPLANRFSKICFFNLEETLARLIKNVKQQCLSELKRVKPGSEKWQISKFYRMQNSSFDSRTSTIRLIMRYLQHASKTKMAACWKKLTSLCYKPSAENGLGCMSLAASLTDLKVLKSLHSHWLSIMLNKQAIKGQERSSGFFKTLARILTEKSKSNETWVLHKLHQVVQNRKTKLKSLTVTLVARQLSKQKQALQSFRSFGRQTKLHKRVLKTYKELHKKSTLVQSTMSPSRIALLARYFAGEELIRIVNKRMTAAFHCIRRHCAIERYRGFYSQLWNWKVSNLKAKYFTQIKAHQRELSEERNLRMRSEERLTKWLSTVSCHAADNIGGTPHKRNNGIYKQTSIGKQLDMKTLERGNRPLFHENRSNRRDRSSSLTDSLGDQHGCAWFSLENQGGTPKDSACQCKPSLEKTISLDRREKGSKLHPIEIHNQNTSRKRAQYQPESPIRIRKNISESTMVKKVLTSSLADHFKLKFKEPRRNFLNKKSSVRENLNESSSIKTDLLMERPAIAALFKTADDSVGAGSLGGRQKAESPAASKGRRTDLKLELSQASSRQPRVRTPLYIFDTPKTGEIFPPTATRNQTLFELWTHRRLKLN